MAGRPPIQQLPAAVRVYLKGAESKGFKYGGFRIKEAARFFRLAAGASESRSSKDRGKFDRMPLLKTSNPALGQNTFRNLADSQYGGTIDASARMTLSGTVNKTGILLLCALATAAWTWSDFLQTRDISDIAGRLMVGTFGGLIVAFVTIFKKEWSAVTAPIYALLEGLALGGISAIFEMRYPGIAIQAVSLTFGTLFVLLLAYRSGLIRVTQKFRLGIVAATGGIMLFYFAEILLGFFGVHFATINGSGPIGILCKYPPAEPGALRCEPLKAA
jgi:uncharacterized YccA/Bax inhibitor family protein